MRRLRSLLLRSAGLFATTRRDRDLAAELEAHLQLHADESIRAGMTPADARRHAVLKLGGMAQVQEAVRDRRGLLLMETTMHDVRYALRSLRRNPGFAVVAIATLALGIGATTAIFSLVDGVLLRPALFRDFSRLMMVWETDRTSGTMHEPASSPDYDDFRPRSTQFAPLAAVAPAEVGLTHATADPRRLAALWVTHDFLQMVGVTPVAGRAFRLEESQRGAAPVAVISEELWGELFGRDPSAVGRSIRLDDIESTIVGVLPRGADFGTLQILGAADYSRGFAERGGRTRVDVWLPLRPNPTFRRENHGMFVIGRLSPGASVASAQQEMSAIAADLERAYPVNAGRGAFVEPMERVVFGPVRPALYVLVAAVGLVLLIACINVANLLLVRASNRVREVSVRAALGAGRVRLARQFFAEGAVLAFAGVAIGIPLAYGALDLLVRLAPATLPRVDLVTVDGRVLGVTLGVSVVAALVFGALPLLHIGGDRFAQTLHGAVGSRTSAGRGAARFRWTLVVGELAIAAMLMMGAALLIRTLWSLQQVDPGFTAAGVLKAEFQLPFSRYPQDIRTFPNWPARVRFADELTSAVARLPGVQSVAVAAANPLDAGFTSAIRVVGREAEGSNWPEPSIRAVSTSYFGTMRLPLLAGRPFGAADHVRAEPVILINAAARQRFFGGVAAIDQHVRLWGGSRRVIGVVGNERFKGLTEAAPPAVYLPLAQAPMASAVLVRTDGNPSLLAPGVRRVVHEIDPQLALFGVEPLTETLGNTQAPRRFTMILLVAFAAVALLLAAFGVHGVLSYSVAQRTREIGIRAALGADVGQIRRLVVSQGARLAMLGIALGLIGALGLTRLLTTLLFGVGARDPLTFAGVGIVLAGVALVAVWLPARRATRVDPMVALRHE
jgi:putative ABC transport system permease protein